MNILNPFTWLRTVTPDDPVLTPNGQSNQLLIELFSWLQKWDQTLSVVSYIILTGFIVLFYAIQTKKMGEQTETMSAAYEPLVLTNTFYSQTEYDSQTELPDLDDHSVETDDRIYFVLSNIGNDPARDLCLECAIEVEEDDRIKNHKTELTKTGALRRSSHTDGGVVGVNDKEVVYDQIVSFKIDDQNAVDEDYSFVNVFGAIEPNKDVTFGFKIHFSNSENDSYEIPVDPIYSLESTEEDMTLAEALSQANYFEWEDWD